jgi:hypothetical protein
LAKIAELGDKMMTLMSSTVDTTNAAEITNVLMVIKKLEAEAKFWRRSYERKTGQKIS